MRDVRRDTELCEYAMLHPADVAGVVPGESGVVERHVVIQFKGHGHLRTLSQAAGELIEEAAFQLDQSPEIAEP